MSKFTGMTVVGAFALTTAVIDVNPAAQSGMAIRHPGIRTDEFAVSPVSGPSNLRRLGLTIRQSALGFTGLLGPSPDQALQEVTTVETPGPLTRLVVLTGADLYSTTSRTTKWPRRTCIFSRIRHAQDQFSPRNDEQLYDVGV